ncbi:MAG TPA: acid phosphatase [Ramlibacter sp.]|uniref:acid phosphatase n=1 Tax=Ramlibacter sp. TaxID=1917967 RepID=UPI002D7F00D8|nr:acid phosphatase [Ramlibacter sp.]HET8747837.1 acid phosphatase [Ramlibacter sp.]
MSQRSLPRRLFLALAAAALLPACAQLPGSAPAKLARIGHVVVIYAENHSFDNMYGLFPGANGIARATPAQSTQVDHDGTPLPELVVFGHDDKPDPRFPRLPNRPFRIDAPPVDKPPTESLLSPTHAFFHHIEQIDGGRNDRFAAMSTVGGYTMGYYDGSVMKVWQWAREYTLADNFFMGAFGGSYLNHHWLICACTPRDPDAPPHMRIRLDAQGRLERRPGSPSAREGAVEVVSGAGVAVTPDGWSVNTTQPPWQPSGIRPAATGPLTHADPAGTATSRPLPPQTARTIGDTLSARGIDWAWYAGAWNAAVADGMQPPDVRRSVIYTRGPAGSPNFQPHHQPFNYYARFAPGTADRARHLKDGEDFLRAITAGTLPPVSFYKPAGVNTQHPAYTDIMTGDAHIAEVLQRLRTSPQWKDMLVIVTYDENGGFWDHVPPPTGPGWGDRFGPGSRIPTILVGPTVKRGFVDSTPYDTTSILKFITERFGLEPLPGVRARMGDLTNALQ